MTKPLQYNGRVWDPTKISGLDKNVHDTQYQIRIEHTMSEAFQVRTGLMLGDLLSPTLFNKAFGKAIREIKMEITRVAIGQQHILSF